MKIIAHRGNNNIHKENSLEALISSINSHYTDGIELDVRLTKDKKLILNHDPFYKGNHIRHTNSLKLRKLGLNILEEILSNIQNSKIIMIEVKVDKTDIKTMLKILTNILNKYSLNFYICSFNYQFIQLLKEKTNFKCGLIISPKINEKHINNEFTFNSISYLYNKKIPQKETFRWTINSKKELSKIPKNSNIITDNVKTIYNLIKEEQP